MEVNIGITHAAPANAIPVDTERARLLCPACPLVRVAEVVAIIA